MYQLTVSQVLMPENPRLDGLNYGTLVASPEEPYPFWDKSLDSLIEAVRDDPNYSLEWEDWTSDNYKGDFNNVHILRNVLSHTDIDYLPVYLSRSNYGVKLATQGIQHINRFYGILFVEPEEPGLEPRMTKSQSEATLIDELEEFNLYLSGKEWMYRIVKMAANDYGNPELLGEVQTIKGFRSFAEAEAEGKDVIAMLNIN